MNSNVATTSAQLGVHPALPGSIKVRFGIDASVLLESGARLGWLVITSVGFLSEFSTTNPTIASKMPVSGWKTSPITSFGSFSNFSQWFWEVIMPSFLRCSIMASRVTSLGPSSGGNRSTDFQKSSISMQYMGPAAFSTPTRTGSQLFSQYSDICGGRGSNRLRVATVVEWWNQKTQVSNRRIQPK